MHIYSKKIVQFIAKVKSSVKEVIAKEMGLRVFGDRFYDKRERISYPIKIVIYNNKSMLGYFAHDFYEFGFHEKLMHISHADLVNIIRHELAHYQTFIEYPEAAAHGVEFRSICKRFGWGEEVFKATTCLDDGVQIIDIEENSILRKVQKLMALSSSQNQHEAELAMIKSQELLLKHNLEYVESDEERVFLIRILKQKKENAKMRAISQILATFFVSCVFSRCSGFVYLELVGNKTNIEIAEYVALFLDKELERLWKESKRENNLQGTVAKNCLFMGIAKGYCNKISALKRSYTTDITKQVIAIENKLVEVQKMCYPRLRYTKSQGSFCKESSRLGESLGSKLTIKPAVTSNSNKCFLISS